MRYKEMNIIKQGDSNRVERQVKRFECSACGCVWEADKTEYFNDWSTYDIPTVCKCPTCNRVVMDHICADGSILSGDRIEMCRTCENWQKDKDCLLNRCVHHWDCTRDGFIQYKPGKRHDLDIDSVVTTELFADTVLTDSEFTEYIKNKIITKNQLAATEIDVINNYLNYDGTHPACVLLIRHPANCSVIRIPFIGADYTVQTADEIIDRLCIEVRKLQANNWRVSE